MAESIKIGVGILNGVDKNGQKKKLQNQPNIANNFFDLTGDDDDDNVVSRSNKIESSARGTHNNIRSGNSETTRTVVDMVPIAQEMWKFTNCSPNPTLTAAYANMPVPIHNTVTKTIIYSFERRPANIPSDQKEYSSKALFYINLLKSHNKRLADAPLQLIGLKCAYCAEHSTHIPGSSSFIRFSGDDEEDMSSLLADAMHQRLLHLRNNCARARQNHGPEVWSLFDNNYNRNDIHLRRFTNLWLKQLKQKLSNAPPMAVTSASKRNVPLQSSIAPVAFTAGTAAAKAHAAATVVHPRPTHSASVSTTHNIATMAAQQRQLQNQHSQFALKQQNSHRRQQLVSATQYGYSNSTQQQNHQLQQRQSQPKRLQKPMQQQPRMFVKYKQIPFEALQQIYENGWEEMTWSMFNPPYESDDDDDDGYFNLVHKNNKNSHKNSLPPLPAPKADLDYCVPIQPYQLAQCSGAVPFLKEDVISSNKTRARLPQS